LFPRVFFEVGARRDTMPSSRPFTRAADRLKHAGLRQTRQRLALARLLFDGGNRHVTAEQLFAEARRDGAKISLATVYNTLHQFTRAGLMREVVVDPGRSYFDTNTAEHYHFFFEDSGRLQDFPEDSVALAALPEPPSGTAISRVDVIIRLSETSHPGSRQDF
jgi:Fur family transcriptional regulator, iron response regulator